ncbi:MAG: ATP-binding protein [Actinobacteria bacterium]|nr:ATP-binding protein [Actinomycetota bacterium]
MHLEFGVSLPRDAETVGIVRAVVTSALVSFGVTPNCVDDIRLALSEACTNVVEHAAADDEYEVRLEVDETRCAISVKNTGIGFDATALAGVMPDGNSPRGRGSPASADRRNLPSERGLGWRPTADVSNHRTKAADIGRRCAKRG